VVVGYCDEKQRKPEDASKCRCRKRPLIDGNSEQLEDGEAECHVGQGEQNLDRWPPIW